MEVQHKTVNVTYRSLTLILFITLYNRPKLEPHLVGQSIKDSPEQFPREMKLFIWCRSKVAPASSQAVILPTTLIVIGQQLGKVHSSTICWLRNIFFKKRKALPMALVHYQHILVNLKSGNNNTTNKQTKMCMLQMVALNYFLFYITISAYF